MATDSTAAHSEAGQRCTEVKNPLSARAAAMTSATKGWSDATATQARHAEIMALMLARFGLAHAHGRKRPLKLGTRNRESARIRVQKLDPVTENSGNP
jgi:hypothetical protein